MAILKIKQPNGSWAIVGDTSETIKFTEQQLTEEQKKVARENIDAINYNELPIQNVSELPYSNADPQVLYRTWEVKIYANYGLDLTSYGGYAVHVVDQVPEEGMPCILNYDSPPDQMCHIYHDLSLGEPMGYVTEELINQIAAPWGSSDIGWKSYYEIWHYAFGSSPGFYGCVTDPDGYYGYCYTLSQSKFSKYDTSTGNWSHYKMIQVGTGHNSEIFNSDKNAATAEHTHAEGYSTSATATSAHAEGQHTVASGSYSHAEGWNTSASGGCAHAEGSSTGASAGDAHAEGANTSAKGQRSHAEGYYTEARGNSQHVQGEYNVIDTKVGNRAEFAHIVGNGTGSAMRSNAHTLDWSGNAWFAGDVYVGSTSGINKDEGSKKLATEEIVDTKVAAMGDTKLDKPATDSNYSRVPFVRYGENTFRYKILATTIAQGMKNGWIAQYNPANRDDNTIPDGQLVTGTPKYDGDCANKKYVDDNFVSKTGDGIIDGNLSITGNLTIQGATYTQDNETLRIADNIIEINSNKADNTTVLSGIAINKNSTSTYGIMYDPASDTVKLGEGATNAGVFSFNEGEGAPLAIRDDSNNIDDGAIMIFDKSKNKLVNSGYTIDTFKQWVRDYVESYMSTITTVDADGGETIEMTVADNLISEKDGILEIGG